MAAPAADDEEHELMTERELLEFQNGPTAESAGKHRDDRTHELKHADDTAAFPRTLAFSDRSEFLVATVSKG